MKEKVDKRVGGLIIFKIKNEEIQYLIVEPKISSKACSPPKGKFKNFNVF